MRVALPLQRKLTQLTYSYPPSNADWEGLNETECVDLLKEVVQGHGLTTNRELPYPDSRNQADLVAYSVLPRAAPLERWFEVKCFNDGTNYLGIQRFEHQERDLLKDFEHLNAHPNTIQRWVVWFCFSDSHDPAIAGTPSQARYSLSQAIQRIHHHYGLQPHEQPVAVDLQATTPGLNIQPSTKWLHVVTWKWPQTPQSSEEGTDGSEG